MAARLEDPPAGRVPIVPDTDTFNEIDDQFAIVQVGVRNRNLSRQPCSTEWA